MRRGNRSGMKVFVGLFVMMFMFSLVAADYKFEDTAGNELMHLYSTNGNMTVTGSIAAPYFVGNGSLLTNINTGAIDLSDYYTQVLANDTFIMQANEGSLNVNGSGYWDGLDSPADISGSQIQNNLAWVNFTKLSQMTNDLGIGNWTLDKSGYYTTSNTYNKTEVDSIVSLGTVNSTNYWDGLNTPADISGSQIQNNLAWINNTKLSEFTNDLGIGNWTLDKSDYYTSGEVDTAIGTANTSMKDYVDSAVSSGTVNSSAFWDNLDSPADILGSEINNDLSWVELANLVGLVGNWSQDKVNYYLINQVYNQSEVDALVSSGAVNSSDYWDDLNTPADIAGSTINDDLNWVEMGEIVAVVGNWSNDKVDYYLSSEVDTAIENANTSMKNYVDTQDVVFNDSMKEYVDGAVSGGAVNSANLWDALDTPADISGSQIQNDLAWANFTKLSEMTNDLNIGNWTLDKSDYYTSGEVDTNIGLANTSMKDYVDGLVTGDVGNANTLDNYDASFFMPLNKSVTGDFDFNGGWTNSGVSIVGGNVYAQSGYFYDINSLQVTNLEVNGSLVPETGFNNTFDIGSSTLMWRDAWFGRNVNVNGVVTAGSFVGDGSGITNINAGDVNLASLTDGTGISDFTYDGTGAVAVSLDTSYTDGRYVEVAGDTMTDVLAMGLNKITGLGNGTSAQDAVSYSQLQQVNSQLSGNISDSYVPYTGATNNVDLNDKNLVNTAKLSVGSSTASSTGVAYFDGNVGIGTTSPQNPLNVIGAVNATSFVGDGSGLTNINVGAIDLSSYYTKTEVNGINTSMKNYVDSKISSDLTPYVQWTTLWTQVYNETEVNAINTSMKNYVDGKVAGDLTGYIPYSGATTNVNLGSKTFTTTGVVTTGDLSVNGGIGPATLSVVADSDNVNEADVAKIFLSQDGAAVTGQWGFDSTNAMVFENLWSGGNINFKTNGVGVAQVNGNAIWHAGNDGSGSTLDADLLDGLHATTFYNASNPAGYITAGDVAVYTAGDALTLNGVDFDFDGGATPGGELGGTWDSPTIDNDALDDQYYDSEADLTDLLYNNYLGINAKAADTDSFDGRDSSTFYNASNPAGYITSASLLTEEEVEDFVGDMFGGTETHISVIYQDTTNDIDFVVSDDWYNSAADVVAGFTSCSGTQYLGADGACHDDNTGTWRANTQALAGYVAAGETNYNYVWKTDASGNPAWRVDDDTDGVYNLATMQTAVSSDFHNLGGTDANTWNANTQAVAGYVAAPGAVNGYVWKTDASGNPAWRADADSGGDITGVTAGNGLTGTATSGTATLNVVSHAGTAGSIGTIDIGADAIGVDLGITSTTAYPGDDGNTAYNDRLKWDGGSAGLTASTGRTSLGATTVGGNLFTMTNPSAVTFLRMNADNTVSALNAAAFRSAIGAGTSSTTGTVTSVGLSMPSIFSVLDSPVLTSGTLTAALENQSANTIFAAPSGSVGAPTFRALTATDIPSLAASKITSGTLGVARGGTGLSASVEDSIMVGSGAGTWQTKAIPDCTTGKLLYTASTNSFSCGTDNNAGGDITDLVEGNAITITNAGGPSPAIAVSASSIDDVEIVQNSIDASEIATGGVATAEILDGTIQEIDLEMTNPAIDNHILSYDSGTGGFTWVDDANAGGDLTAITEGTAITVTNGAGPIPAIGVTAGSITDTQLAFNTGQHLMTTSAPTFATVKTPRINATAGNDIVIDSTTGTGNIVMIFG